jgi:choline dehydrogenase-like flavoprotein
MYFRHLLAASLLTLATACASLDDDEAALSGEPTGTAEQALVGPQVNPVSDMPTYDDSGCYGPGCSGGLEDGEFEYVIVGAGAGGGPLAAGLAKRGHKVLLLEAGGDPGDRLTYQIPAWHVLASEDPAMRWDYFVDHYDDAAQAGRDDKLVRDGGGNPKGIWYPRGSAVGGSTAVHAMIALAPHASDWNHIADTVAAEDPDGSWRPGAMRTYFERAERNGYLPPGTGGHGFDGWMNIDTRPGNLLDFLMSAADLKMLRIILATTIETTRVLGENGPFDPIRDVGRILGYLIGDINAGDPGRDGREGVFRVPTQSRDGHRIGVRELVLDTIRAGHPLTLKTRALVTGVTLDRSGATPKAVGVGWIDGPNLYQGSPRSDAAQSGTAHEIRVTREVILSAGAFNTPQLLMLSGIGPRAALEQQGIESIVDLPGVGANLQDRYEVGVIGEMTSVFGDAFRLLKDCSFDPTATRTWLDQNDPCYLLWKNNAGVYTINGSVVGVVKRSRPELADPDLFIFGIPGYFKGYFPGYSAQTVAKRNHFTWVVLKAHSTNADGAVTLRSADPRERPAVSFRYFGEGGDADGDLSALVDGVLFARKIVERTRALSPFTDSFREVYPGTELDTREEVTQFIKDKAWGHHACCTAKIGAADDPMAVLDSRFRVRGTEGLRVVDASAFPRIPGFFIAVPIYMISEKAADVIHADALAQ